MPTNLASNEAALRTIQRDRIVTITPQDVVPELLASAHVVGRMSFDPVQGRWIKAGRRTSDTTHPFDIIARNDGDADDEQQSTSEEDIFKDIESFHVSEHGRRSRTPAVAVSHSALVKSPRSTPLAPPMPIASNFGSGSLSDDDGRNSWGKDGEFTDDMLQDAQSTEPAPLDLYEAALAASKHTVGTQTVAVKGIISPRVRDLGHTLLPPALHDPSDGVVPPPATPHFASSGQEQATVISMPKPPQTLALAPNPLLTPAPDRLPIRPRSVLKMRSEPLIVTPYNGSETDSSRKARSVSFSDGRTAGKIADMRVDGADDDDAKDLSPETAIGRRQRSALCNEIRVEEGDTVTNTMNNYERDESSRAYERSQAPDQSPLGRTQRIEQALQDLEKLGELCCQICSV